MNRIIIILISLISLGLVNEVDNHSTVPKTLKGTNWTSQFFHYCNNYYFDSDSTGFSEDGQVAWSYPVDTLELGISSDDILYANPEKFKYDITDTILTIEYLTFDSKSFYERVFYFRPKYSDWISEYEYVYGRECLREGEKKEKFP